MKRGTQGGGGTGTVREETDAEWEETADGRGMHNGYVTMERVTSKAEFEVNRFMLKQLPPRLNGDTNRADGESLDEVHLPPHLLVTSRHPRSLEVHMHVSPPQVRLQAALS